MQRKALILFLFIIQVSQSYGLTSGEESIWSSKLNTAETTGYLSTIEKEVILEINKLRSNPSKYADEYIVPLKERYQKNYLFYPGDKPLATKEGVRALNECIRALKQQSSLPVLFPDEGLSKAAGDHVKDQSRSGKTGHVGSDRSKVKDRIERYGQWKVRIAENIAYGGINARQIVIYLLIDDGVKSRGHRKNFLHPDYRMVGVAVGRHPRYQSMWVMDFAGAFSQH